MAPVIQLRWGILSTAGINHRLIRAVRASERSELVAVASRDLTRAKDYAQQWQIGRHHGSYEALLRDPGVDVIYNPLPNHLHVPWSIRTMQAGKHVLCEKPVALHAEGVDALVQAAEKTGFIFAEGFMYRHQPRTRRVKELVESGVIGDLRFVDGAFSFLFDRPGNFRHDPEAGGGALWDVGCYPVSFARYVVGQEPEHVQAWSVQSDSGVDMSLAGLMRFPSGVLATFRCGFESSYQSEMTFAGTHGVLRLARPFQAAPVSEIMIEVTGGTKTELVEGFELPFIGEVQDMERVVLDGARQEIPWSESRGNAATLRALHDSATRS